MRLCVCVCVYVCLYDKTQGRSGLDSGNGLDWVTEYSISCSDDKCNGTRIGGKFNGNIDRDTKVFSLFNDPVTTKFLKVTVNAFSGQASMRWDALVPAKQRTTFGHIGDSSEPTIVDTEVF